MSAASLGTPVARREGPAKLTGAARYTGEQPVDGVLHAWPVQSPVARGVLRAVDTHPDVAGVVAVLWHGNAPRLAEVDDAELWVLQTDRISYRGQAVALVVATTLEAASEAAGVLTLDIEELPHDVVLRADHPERYTPEKVNPDFPAVTVQGDPDAALRRAPFLLDRTYTTPAEHNNPMEPHATVAAWSADGTELVLHDSTQGPSTVAGDVAPLFGLEPGQVRVLAEHVGGGFGSKGSARPNAVLAAVAAKVTGRPVKLVLPRQSMFTIVGHRTPTVQRVRLGATAEGVLEVITHDVVEQTSRLFEFAEQTALSTRHVYAAEHRRTSHQLVRLDVPTPRWMRAPGEAPGMFAVESAVDELATLLGIDPIELRVRNEPDVDPDSGKPFSSRHYVECLREGARRFGWDRRDPRPRRQREGEWWVGTGVGGAIYPANLMPSTARARALPGGRFEVAIAAADIGQGSRTVLTQIAADALGVPLDAVDVLIGDSTLPKASVAGGSSGTASWGSAVTGACAQLRRDLAGRGGAVPPGGLEATYDTTEDVQAHDPDGKNAFGAHFAQVRVNDLTGEVRVTRMLGVYAAGRILNPRTARSQFLGGMTMGIGMALLEEGVLDAGTGDWVNHDLAEYHVPVSSDVPAIEVHWLEEHDDQLDPMGSKGIGELGIVGSPAAVVNAVWHACGVRVRDLPVRLDKLLPALEDARGR